MIIVPLRCILLGYDTSEFEDEFLRRGVCCLLHNFVLADDLGPTQLLYTCCLKVKRRKHDNERGISTASGIRIHINLPTKSERGHPIIRSIPYYQSKDQYLQGVKQFLT